MTECKERSEVRAPWRADFVEFDGYDCMTNAWYIKELCNPIPRIVAELDCGSNPTAERDAKLIVEAINALPKP